MAETTMNEAAEVAENARLEKSAQTAVDRIFEVISRIFLPIVPVLMAAGMFGALLTIAELCGLTSPTDPTYYVLNLVYRAGFYFLPLFIAYSASQSFGANPFISMLLTSVMLHPYLVPELRMHIAEYQALDVDELSFLGIAIPSLSYAQSVLPIILGTWVLSYVDHFFDNVFPEIVKPFMAPTCTMLVMVPLMLIVIGPVGTYLSDLLAAGIQWLGNHLGGFAVAVIAALVPVMVATGTNSFAFPIIIASIAMNGFDQLLMPAMVAANLAMGGAAMALALLKHGKAERGTAISASVSAALGISEPATYGVNLPSKVGFAGSIVGASIGGLLAGIFGLRMYMVASPSVIGVPAMFGDLGVSNVIVGVLVIVVAFFAGFVVTVLLSKTKESHR